MNGKCDRCGDPLTGKQVRWCSKKNCRTADSIDRRRRAFKTKAVEYKGGKCERCGYNKSLAALGFHHIDPSEKKYTPSKLYRLKWEETARPELDKCELLCANCHMETHWEDWQSG